MGGSPAAKLLRRLAGKAAGGPESSIAHGASVGERRSYWVRRWRRRIALAVMDAMDTLLQQRMVASCGASVALLGEL